jgi:hypothetical protein
LPKSIGQRRDARRETITKLPAVIDAGLTQVNRRSAQISAHGETRFDFGQQADSASVDTLSVGSSVFPWAAALPTVPMLRARGQS